jgi:hypothetical protein
MKEKYKSCVQKSVMATRLGLTKYFIPSQIYDINYVKQSLFIFELNSLFYMYLRTDVVVLHTRRMTWMKEYFF